MTVTVYTSIMPRIVRQARGEDVSLEYQRACIASWLRAGFDLVTINNDAEADDISKMFPEVRIINVPDKRPKISQFISIILDEKKKCAGITNSDIIFSGDQTIAGHIERIAEQGLLLVERLSFDPDTLVANGLCNGFDGFFFDTSVLNKMKMDQNIRIGDSWWDDIFPLAYLEAGGKLYQASSPFLLHLDHVIAWNEANFISGGLLARAMFGGRFGFSASDNDGYESLDRFSHQMYRRVKSLAEPVGLRGEGIAALMGDQIASSIPKHIKTPEDDENAAQTAVISYRLRRPSNPPLGEFLCTLSHVVRRLPLGRGIADGLFQIGDDLQFRAYYKAPVEDREVEA